jgi:hypothetical protein
VRPKKFKGYDNLTLNFLGKMSPSGSGSGSGNYASRNPFGL